MLSFDDFVTKMGRGVRISSFLRKTSAPIIPFYEVPKDLTLNNNEYLALNDEEFCDAINELLST